MFKITARERIRLKRRQKIHALKFKGGPDALFYKFLADVREEAYKAEYLEYYNGDDDAAYLGFIKDLCEDYDESISKILLPQIKRELVKIEFDVFQDEIDYTDTEFTYYVELVNDNVEFEMYFIANYLEDTYKIELQDRKVKGFNPKVFETNGKSKRPLFKEVVKWLDMQRKLSAKGENEMTFRITAAEKRLILKRRQSRGEDVREISNDELRSFFKKYKKDMVGKAFDDLMDLAADYLEGKFTFEDENAANGLKVAQVLHEALLNNAIRLLTGKTKGFSKANSKIIIDLNTIGVTYR